MVIFDTFSYFRGTITKKSSNSIFSILSSEILGFREARVTNPGGPPDFLKCSGPSLFLSFQSGHPRLRMDEKTKAATGNASDDHQCGENENGEQKKEQTPRIQLYIPPQKRQPIHNDSFWRLDPTYQKRQTYDTENKIMPLSQPDAVKTTSKEMYPCPKCKRFFKSKSGRTNHLKKCSETANTLETSERGEDVVLQITEKMTSKIKPIAVLLTTEKNESNKVNTISTVGSSPLPVPSHLLPEKLFFGKYTAEDLKNIIDLCYEVIVFFKKNFFMLPSGKVGKDFIAEMTKLVDYWNTKAEGLSNISIKMLMCMPGLLLQKPHYHSKTKDNSEALKRRMTLWMEGDFMKLLNEAKELQSRLRTTSFPYSNNIENLSKKFSNFMLKGNIKAALRLLDETPTKGVLPLNDETIESLRNLHPDGKDADQDVLINSDIPEVDPIIFEAIDGHAIMKSALKTKGSAGPSGLDAEGWRRILASKNYGSVGTDLRNSLATMLKTLCTTDINLDRDIEAYLACRLIPLDKGPGVRPIGVGEVIRRIFGKTIINTIKGDIMKSAGSLQLCAGQQAGCEAAVHAMNEIFHEEAIDAIILVDASNAFNSLNRNVFIHNIKILCPPMARYVINCYKNRSRLFIIGGKELASDEGTTQGDPFAMPTYGIGLTPLLDMLKEIPLIEIKQAAFADDLAGGGSLDALKQWWDKINIIGPLYGYFPKASKSWIIVKDEKYEDATNVFMNCDVNITTEGHKYLGGTIGKNEFKISHVDSMVAKWVEQIKILAEIAKSQPQAAYTAFVNGFVSKFTYHLRTIKDIRELLKPVDNAIDQWLIPALTEGHQCSADERKLLSLPVKLGGLAIPILSDIADNEFENSKDITRDLTGRIVNQIKEFPGNGNGVKYQVARRREKAKLDVLERLRERMDRESRKANELAQTKGASNWLTALPLEKENFNLSKREFFDAIAVRYKWQMKNLPSTCPCSKSFTIDHALSCPKGGFIYKRHNELRDTIAVMINEVKNDVRIEPQLEPISGEQLRKGAILNDGARSDISAMGFWSRNQRAFFDIRVFNAYAQRYANTTLKSAFVQNEKEKKRQYNERIVNVDRGSFTPLIFTTNGGTGRECEHFIKALALQMSDKKDERYAMTINYIRTKLSFALIRSSVLCLRGTRTLNRKKITLSSDINITESISYNF